MFFFWKKKHHDVVAHLPSFQLSTRSSSFFCAFFLNFYGTPFFWTPDTIQIKSISPSILSNISSNIHPILKVKKRHKTTLNLKSNATNPVFLCQTVQKWHAIEVDCSSSQMAEKSKFVSLIFFPYLICSFFIIFFKIKRD